MFLKEHNITSYIKLQDHEKRKTRAYKEDIGKHYNMTYQIFEDEHYYVCHDGRELRHIHTETKGLYFRGVLLFPYNWVRNRY